MENWKDELDGTLRMELKNVHIKGLVQGFAIANSMLKDYCEGHTIDEVKEFCIHNCDKQTLKLLEGKYKKVTE